MRYKDRTPDAQAIRGRMEESRVAFYRERGEPVPPRKKINPPLLHTLSQYALDNHYQSMVGIGEQWYICGTFVRASERYTNWPR